MLSSWAAWAARRRGDDAAVLAAAVAEHHAVAPEAESLPLPVRGIGSLSAGMTELGSTAQDVLVWRGSNASIGQVRDVHADEPVDVRLQCPFSIDRQQRVRKKVKPWSYRPLCLDDHALAPLRMVLVQMMS